MEMSVWENPDEESQSPRDIKGFNLALGLVDQVSAWLINRTEMLSFV